MNKIKPSKCLFTFKYQKFKFNSCYDRSLDISTHLEKFLNLKRTTDGFIKLQLRIAIFHDFHLMVETIPINEVVNSQVSPLAEVFHRIRMWAIEFHWVVQDNCRV